MICELFPFQTQAVNDMRLRVAMALNNYRMLKIPQVVSLQAPTGSGKTIIMSALIEDTLNYKNWNSYRKTGATHTY
jgi:type III restriction enzyme